MIGRRIAFAVILVALTAGMAYGVAIVGWGRPSDDINMRTGAEDVSARILSEPTVSATATGWWEGQVLYNDRRYLESTSDIAELVQLSPAVADVHVVAMGPVLFNTDTGEAPTPEPTFSGFGVALGSIVVLEVDQAYKGIDAGTAGFVVWQWGGSVDGLTDRSLPPLVFLPDSSGTAFVSPLAEEEISGAHASLKLMVEAAAEWSEPGAEFQPATLLNFYEHVGDVALSALEGDGPYEAYKPREVELAGFIQELIEALPTPTP